MTNKASHKDSSENPLQPDDVSGLIDSTQQLLDTGFRHLRRQCGGEEFAASRLEAHQQVCYDLALASADLAAARALLDYARPQSLPLVGQVTRAFVAETLNAIQGRLVNQEDTGIDVESWLRWRAQPMLSHLLAEGLNVEGLAAVGEQISRQSLYELPAGLDDEKIMVQASFRRFADQVVAPLAAGIHREDRDIPEALIRQAAELGCFGTCIPERFGGLQPDDAPDSLGMIVVTEELSRGSLGAAGSLITRPEIAARALLRGGSDAQQSHWLPRLAAGDTLCAIAITEPDTGSDVAAVSLQARPVEGGWQLNGSKTWCTFAGRSELLLVLARTVPDTAAGYRGLSLFLVEKPAFTGHEFDHLQAEGGRLSGKAIATLGYRGMHSFDLFFEDFLVPAANLVGEQSGEGQGFYYTMAGFSGGRIQTAARANGVMQAAFEAAVDYANQRLTFGKTIAEHQLIRVKLARMLARLTASRQFSYAVARQLDQGGGQMQASLVKLFACRAAEWVTREAMQIHGGMGYAEESAVSRYFVDARVLSIFEGTEEVLALKVIARELVENSQ